MGSNNSEIHGYDASGNQYVFTWDDEDRLASTTLPEGHTDGNAYTGLGMRLSKTDGGVGYAYLCDGVSPASPVLSDGQLSFTPGISQTLGTPNGSGGMSYASHFYAEDAVGNLRGMSDAGVQGFPDAYNWDAFGQLIGRAGGTSTPFGYGEASGSQADGDSGLRLLGHRYYDSRTGRFISQDPAGDGDNWYAYADNDPIDETDPMGLEPDWPGQPDDTGEIPGFNGTPTGYGNDGRPYFIPNGAGTVPDGSDPNTFNYDLNSFGYRGPNGTSGPADANNFGFGGLVDNWVTFGTVTHAANVAGAYDSGHASRGAAFGAGALAVGAIVAAGASRGRDAAGGDAAKFLTEELLATSRRINPCKQAENLVARYGGKASNWVKKSTQVIEHPETGEDVEIHWFENMKDNLGRIDIKWKFNPWE